MQTYQTPDWKDAFRKRFPDKQTGINARTYQEMLEHIDSLLQAREEWLKEALEWVLPMAKAYAHEHDVGNNKEIVDHAADRLSTLTPKN